MATNDKAAAPVDTSASGGAQGDVLAIGEKVLIRTVTFYYVGVILAFNFPQENPAIGFVRLGEPSWIPNTGRFSECLKSGTFEEQEPYPGPVEVSLASIVDATRWDHDLPKTVK